MTVKIVIFKQDKPVDQVLLKSDSTTIGRKSDCDISIKDPAVSGQHARIEKTSKGYVIEDLNSTNGVHVAGHRIDRHELKNGDVVMIGEHKLKFIMADKKVAASSRTDAARTGASRTGASRTSASRTAVHPEGKGSGREARAGTKAVAAPGKQKEPPEAGKAARPVDLDKGYLIVRSGAGAGDRIELSDSLTTVGEPGIQVAAVSRRPQGHFIIHVDGGKDKNRVPLVNGEPTGFKSRRLEPGDLIEVARIEMEYCV